MCTSHQPGSVTRFHMAIVAIMVLLLFVTAVITGTCSLSSEGNLLRHTAPVPAHTVSSLAPPEPMARCMPGCPMHDPCAPAPQHHHSSPTACALCTAPEPQAIVSAAATPTGTFSFARVTFPGLPSTISPALALAAPDPPPLDAPLSARPAALRL